MSWVAIAVMSLAAYGAKAAGFGFTPRGTETSARGGDTSYVSRVVGLLPAALFSGLVVTQTLSEGTRAEVTSRVVAVALSALVAIRTRSLPAALVVAAGVAAGLRFLF